MAVLLCPVCGAPLREEETRLACPAGHSFDRARSGYVNLLRTSAQGRHGDDKPMVRARRAFLDKGYYDPLARELAALTAARFPARGVLVDAGCGEGKYTADVLHALRAAGKAAEAVGVDISKDALAYAAKRVPEAAFAVASAARMPLPDESADALLNIFAPFVPEEFARVLKPGGVLLRAYPLARHLWELKALVYERPYENPPTPLAAAGFRLAETRELRYTLHLPCREDVEALFRMTPYWYKTGKEDQAKLARAEALDVTAAFGVAVYERE